MLSKAQDHRGKSHRYSVRLLLLLAALLPALLPALGVTVAATATTPSALAQSSDLDRQVREIGADLRCPVCQNLSVADSPSPLAGEMRDIIRQKLQAGESRQAIMQYFVDSYGESILLDPPQQGFTLLVWLGAVVAVVGGAGLLALRLRLALATEGRVRDRTSLPLAPQSGVTQGRSAPIQAGSGDDERGKEDWYEAVLDTQLEKYKQGIRM